MATKADFTSEEWEALEHGLAGTTLLVSLADRGLFDSFKEAREAAKHISGAQRDSSSTLVRDLASSPSMRFGLGKSPQELEAETLDALRRATSTLSAKAPDELDAYRQFVLEVAQSVAEAAKGVDPTESAAIQKIQGAVGAT